MPVLGVLLAGGLLAAGLPAARALRARRDGDDCECLSWSGVFMRSGALCGDGHEFSFTYRHWTPSWLAHTLFYHELCEEFYHKLDDNSCTNKLQDNAWYNDQWCYVAKECPDAVPANGSNVVWLKTCKQGVDNLMRDKTPEELHQLAKEFGLNMGVLVKEAYQIESNVANWSMIEPLYHDDATISLAQTTESASSLIRGNTAGITQSSGNFSELAKSRVDATALSALEELQASGQAYVLESNTGRAPFAIVKGQRAFVVEKDPENYREGFPWTYTKFRCIRNCGEPAPPGVVYTH